MLAQSRRKGTRYCWRFADLQQATLLAWVEASKAHDNHGLGQLVDGRTVGLR